MGFIGQHKVVVMITTGTFGLLLLTLLAIFLATHLSSSEENSGSAEGLSDISTQELIMKWLNQPGKVVNATETGVEMTVDPDTDYWRITHYGFIRDNGPFYYAEQEGDFEASVKVTGAYKELFHQAGLMLRLNDDNWIKTGIEFVDDVQHVSAVVTHNVSDWSVVPSNAAAGTPVWLKLLRKGDFVEIKYSFDNVKFDMLRLAYFDPKVKSMIGMYAAAPGKLPFNVKFEDFNVTKVE
ncbi:regulation of enolase protein 1 [Ditylenchus destructor]|nr:regulation of enolase protein 1 [Ditylenchus destructor]